MSLADHYLSLKFGHQALVGASGGLFALRGAGVLAAWRWADARALRIASVLLDTLLFAAGVTLWALLSLDLARHPWLAAKLVLLVLYVALGTFALRRGRTRAVRAACYVAALATFAFMVSVAIARHPLGIFAP
jgi:uncharacterized membrane protein SirB2